ncbi:MAG: hypothetical protein EPO21_07670 [Chloroflexota bacterium]|nr:MAG: hypothetical protein EPO21_07670 [Chloroflexota bacterium]
MAAPRVVKAIETATLTAVDTASASVPGTTPSAVLQSILSPTSSASLMPTPEPMLVPTQVPTLAPNAEPARPTMAEPTLAPSAIPTLMPTSTATEATATPQPLLEPTSSATAGASPTASAYAASGKIIAIDPGHGGAESGAVHVTAGKVDLVEKDVNLTIAWQLASLLQREGYRPLLIRQSDRAVNEPARDLNGDGQIDGDDDLQARVDVANAAGADLLLSIHNNGDSSPSTRGTSTWYCADRPFGDQNRRLALLVQSSLMRQLKLAGYTDAIDGGAHDDPPLQKPFGHLFVVGPQTPRVSRPSTMPGVVGESLFVTSDREAKLLSDESVLLRIAQAYLDAVVAFFSKE